MALDRIDWQNLGITINGCRLTTLTYADDVAVVARNRSDLATMIGKLIVECGKGASCKNYVTDRKSKAKTTTIGQRTTVFVSRRRKISSTIPVVPY